MGGGGKAGGRSKGFPFRVSLRELGLLQGGANAVAMKLRAWKGRAGEGAICQQAVGPLRRQERANRLEVRGEPRAPGLAFAPPVPRTSP